MSVELSQPMSKLILWSVYGIILFVSVVSTSVAADRQPNVLFLAVDDMNDWIGCLPSTPQRPHTQHQPASPLAAST